MSFAYFLLLISLLFLPGCALLVARPTISDNKFLISFSFSYGVFSLAVLLFRKMEWPIDKFKILVSAYMALSLVLVVYMFLKQRRVYDLRKVNSLKEKFTLSVLAPLFIVVCVVIYHYIVGPYNEIPSDFYAHVESVRSVFTRFEADAFAGYKLSGLLKHDAGVWYHLVAFTIHISGISFDGGIYLITLVTKACFLLGTYYFSLAIFRDKPRRILISLLATLLTAILMGINVFAYIRYYSLAPTILAWLIYYAAISTVLGMLQEKNTSWIGTKLIFIIYTLIVALSVHTQEAIYIAVMSAILLVVYSVKVFASGKDSVNFGLDKTIIMLTAMTLLIAIGFYCYAHLNLAHFGNYANRLWVLPTQSNGLWPQWAILNLGYQFIRVVTMWGLLVYVLFFLNFARYKNNLFIIAGMFCPLLTIVNPFFTDVFLRLTDSTVLWRFSYLIPIYYVGADLLILYSTRILNYAHESKQQVLISSAVLLSAAVLMLPFYNTWQGVHYSRYPTLKSVPDERSYKHLSDVIEFLQTIKENKVLITDPVTGYVLSGFTRHHNYRDKFYCLPYSKCRQFIFDDYSNHPLDKYKGALLVVNKRTQGYSFVGDLAKHWPESILDGVGDYYSSELILHIQQYPQNFSEVYSQDRLMIYEIK